MTAKLVFMVDTSGSMLEGNKKEQVCSIVDKQNIDHLFAFGDAIRGEFTASQLRELEFNTGTQLQHCLLEIFKTLKILSGNKKNFVLITDAEDTIPFVEDVKTAWKECQDYHKNQGTGDGFLTGEPIFIGRGECAKDIEEIFGVIQQIDDDRVMIVLQNLTEALKAAKKCEEEVTQAKDNMMNIKLEQVEAEKKIKGIKNTHIRIKRRVNRCPR